MAKITKRYKALQTPSSPGKAVLPRRGPEDHQVQLEDQVRRVGRRRRAPRRRREEVRPAGARLDRAARRHRQVGARRRVLPPGREGRRSRWPPARKSSAWTTWPRRCSAGDLNYDVVIATPDAMRVVGKLGQVLGPRGLMPNPKVGTVSPDAAGAVRNAKAGQVRYRTDKAGIIHCTIGKASFEADALKQQPARAARRPDQGQAGAGQGPVPAEDLAELDDGRRRGRRPVARCRSRSNSYRHGRGAGSPGRTVLKAPREASREREPSKTAGAVSA